jgi:hypothetical protein
MLSVLVFELCLTCQLATICNSNLYLGEFVTLPLGQFNWSCNLIHVKEVIYFLDTYEKNTGFLFRENLPLNFANL